MRILTMVGWLAGVLLATNLFAQDKPECPDPRLAVDLPVEIRANYRNPDGSCVQCSIGMCGNDQNVIAAERLLNDFDRNGDGKISSDERKVRGGSGPSRVAGYARQRNLKIYNVTGSATFDWMKWACKTGRGAAIGAGGNHFQTLFGYDSDEGVWWVCNNNSTDRIDEYDEAAFRRLHFASGPWIVILDYPPHPARPEYREWWK